MTVAFTWNGLRALGVHEASLATFPEEFKQGMVARAEILGDTGVNHPDHWVGGLASPNLHAIVILFARNAEEHERCMSAHQKLLAQCEGVEVLSSLDLEATPPFDYAHDHFGYRDRLSQPVIEGIGRGADAWLRCPAQAWRIHPGLSGRRWATRQSRLSPRYSRGTAATWPIAACRNMWVRFAIFCASTGRRPKSRSCIAAKLMGRWRSGAPLVLAPDKDDPALGADMQRNNDFNYKEMDPHGYAVPLGAQCRRMNPAGHGGEHEPAAHDPARGYLRATTAGGRPGGRRRARHRRIRDLRAASFASSSSRRTCGSTTRIFMSWATSAIRSSATRTAPSSSRSRGVRSGRRSPGSRIHHGAWRSLLLPARPQGTPVPHDGRQRSGTGIQVAESLSLRPEGSVKS